MDINRLKERIDGFRNGTEKVMNGKMGRTRVSWSVLFFAVGVLVAIVQIIRSVLYFFN